MKITFKARSLKHSPHLLLQTMVRAVLNIEFPPLKRVQLSCNKGKMFAHFTSDFVYNGPKPELLKYTG